MYGFEYKEGYEEDGAYITWINNDKKAWRVGAGGVGANPLTQISARPIPKEPMVGIYPQPMTILTGTVVCHCQFGHVRGLWRRRLRESRLPDQDVGRLYTDIPTP